MRAIRTEERGGDDDGRDGRGRGQSRQGAEAQVGNWVLLSSFSLPHSSSPQPAARQLFRQLLSLLADLRHESHNTKCQTGTSASSIDLAYRCGVTVTRCTWSQFILDAFTGAGLIQPFVVTWVLTILLQITSLLMLLLPDDRIERVDQHLDRSGQQPGLRKPGKKGDQRAYLDTVSYSRHGRGSEPAC